MVPVPVVVRQLMQQHSINIMQQQQAYMQQQKAYMQQQPMPQPPYTPEQNGASDSRWLDNSEVLELVEEKLKNCLHFSYVMGKRLRAVDHTKVHEDPLRSQWKFVGRRGGKKSGTLYFFDADKWLVHIQAFNFKS